MLFWLNIEHQIKMSSDKLILVHAKIGYWYNSCYASFINYGILCARLVGSLYTTQHLLLEEKTKEKRKNEL